MKKLYLDCTEGEVVSVYVRDAEVIPAGTTVYTMPLRERGPAYDRGRIFWNCGSGDGSGGRGAGLLF